MIKSAVDERVIFAGFGGQGVMSMGMLLTYAGMLEEKQVSWLPSYGPEMRGGTANCNVIISDKMIGSPILTTNATCAVVMNTPSLDKFENDIEPGGNLLINSSLIERKSKRDDIGVYYIPVNDMALELGNNKVANMIMLGCFLAINNTVEVESVLEAFKKVFGPSKEHLVPLNREAIQKGYDFIMNNK
ncbi:MAG: 2-oxoacid:acceptor oxidoreductase family protein [Bacillota bacterium]|nr:2-oxoacid:acceptor oxidoreductase family protein [Bacillota bacterium]